MPGSLPYGLPINGDHEGNITPKNRPLEPPEHLNPWTLWTPGPLGPLDAWTSRVGFAQSGEDVTPCHVLVMSWVP